MISNARLDSIARGQDKPRIDDLRLLASELIAARKALRRAVKQVPGNLARTGCLICDSSWLTTDLWERHKPGCPAVDPAKLADRVTHEDALLKRADV